MFTKTLGAAAAAVAMFAMTPAFAVPFGPATAAFSSLSSPIVTLGAPTSTVDVTSPAGADFLFNGTGSLAGGTKQGQGNGTITFSDVPNTLVNQNLAGLFTFSDGSGGQYQFDLQYVDTVTYSVAGLSNSFGLYLLGNMFDTNLGLDSTATSLTLTFNNTNGSSYSLSGSLSNPPAGVPTPPGDTTVPEPASLMLLGAGLVGLGVIRRRK